MPSDVSSVKKFLSSKYTAIVILIIVSIGVYLNTLPNEFVYDDEGQVLGNLWISDVKNIPEIFLTNVWAFVGEENLSNYYRPLMHMIYMIDYHIFGLKPWGFHLTNIIFHAGVTLLVFLIASILINQSHDLNSKSHPEQVGTNLKYQILSAPFISALLFAVHPIHTEAVAWIGGIPELSFTLFYLLSFYFYIYPVRDKSLNGRGSCKSIEEIASAVIPAKAGIQKSLVLKNTGFPIKTSGMTNRDFCKNLRIKVNGKWGKGFILSVFFFFLATLCKETALTLPLLMLVYDYSISRSSVYSSRFTVHSIMKRYFPYLIVSIIYFILRTYAIGEFAPLKRHAELSNYEYLINIFPIVTQYLEKLILPINMNAFYVFHPISSIFQWKGIIAIILTLVFIFLVYFFRKNRIVFLSLLWIVIPLLPVLYIPALGENTFTERYLYLPSVGFVVLGALAIERISHLKVLRQTANYVIISILVILTGLYSAGTIKRNYIWKDNYSLWTDTTKKSPNAHIPHNNMGNAYYKKGEINKAFKHYQIALELSPNFSEVHNNLGLSYYKKGEIDKAIEHYQTAIKLKRGSPAAHNNLGTIYSKYGRFDEAIKEYLIAIKLKPDFPEPHNDLGNVYANQGRFNEALNEYMTALRFKPDYAEAHNNLGNVYAVQGRPDEAIKEYLIVLRLTPEDAETHNNLANAYSEIGELNKAIEHYQIALRLIPDYHDAHYNLGLVYLEKGLKHKAEEEFKTVLKLRPDFILLQPKSP